MAAGANKLLKNAVILDIETLGLARGLPIHEIAVYSFDNQEVREWLLRPSMVEVDNATAQDFTRLASSVHDVHKQVKFTKWQDAVKRVAELRIGSKLKSQTEVRKALEWASPFIYDALYGAGPPKHPHLLDMQASAAAQVARIKKLAQSGIALKSQADVTIEQVLLGRNGLKRYMNPSKEGQTIWIANAAFESKQIGAQLAALGPDAVEQFKAKLETRSEYGDAFYVTGREVNQARVKAQMDGDWTGVWRAYNKYTPKAGQVAVRDIQDVTRAMMSYGRKLGLMQQGDSYFGASIDLTYRLFGSLEKNPALAKQMLLIKEAHRAVEDTAISEKYVLEKLLHYTEALQAVEEQSDRGKELVRLSKSQKGAYYEAGQYFKRLESIAPELNKVNLIKRLERAAIDIEQQGKTWITNGYNGVQQMEQLDPDNNVVRVPRLRHNRDGFQSMEQVTNYLARTSRYGDYGIDIHAEWARMRAKISENVKAGKSKERAIIEASTAGTDNVIESYFHQNADELLKLDNQVAMKRTAARYGAGQFIDGVPRGLRSPKMYGRAFAAAGVGLAALGATWTLLGGPNSSSLDRVNDSVMTMNYEEWKNYQSSREGLAEQGMAKQTRRYRTDFGSPYRGPETSANVLHDQELLQARERYMRQQYGATHFDPVNGLFGIFSPFKNIGREGYTFHDAGRPLGEGDLPGIQKRRGMKVLDVDPNKWDMHVEDVDTIVLKKKGLRSAVGRFFGLNQDMTFRLEGIDSTEIWHGSGDDAYHVPQPGAVTATEGMRALLQDKKIQIAFDPTEMTYGRNVGVLYSAGKNLNLEAVRRGLAAHLPYGKYEDANINWASFAAAEDKAIASNRGMWSNPWAQTYAAFSQASGNQITFNTFARKERLVQNQNTMNILTLMEHAQEMGSASAYHIEQAARIGKSWSPKGDHVRPQAMVAKQQPHYAGYMNHMMYDQRRFMSTYGTNSNARKHASMNGVDRMNSYLALDTMGSTNAVWSRRQLHAYEAYATQQRLNGERKARMAQAQREINQSFGRTPIGHHRM